MFIVVAFLTVIKLNLHIYYEESQEIADCFQQSVNVGFKN